MWNQKNCHRMLHETERAGNEQRPKRAKIQSFAGENRLEHKTLPSTSIYILSCWLMFGLRRESLGHWTSKRKHLLTLNESEIKKRLSKDLKVELKFFWQTCFYVFFWSQAVTSCLILISLLILHIRHFEYSQVHSSFFVNSDITKQMWHRNWCRICSK